MKAATQSKHDMLVKALKEGKKNYTKFDCEGWRILFDFIFTPGERCLMLCCFVKMLIVFSTLAGILIGLIKY